MKDKLQKIGIQSIKELRALTESGQRICEDVWHGRRPLSKKMALIIKEKTGASLDYLLS